MRATALGIVAVFVVGAGIVLQAQIANNPYKVNYNWDKLEGRKIGVASGIKPDPDGKHLWILDRCGSNGCGDSPQLDPILQVDMEGRLVKSFGKGTMNFPHGFFIDHQGNVWVTDGAPAGDPRGEAGFKKGLGHQIYKFSPDGTLLMRIGEAGVAGADETHFNGPTGVVVAASGDIWVTDGHGGPTVPGPYANTPYRSRGGNNRLVRLSPEGKFIKQWGGGVGSEGALPLQFNDPHDIAIDKEGRLYIADRGNQRVQVLDKDGNFITRWTQFGKPSAIAIDERQIYVADGMSDPSWNPGWERGIRIGDLKTGWLKAFIPDEEATRGAGTEFLGVDALGRIFSGASGRPGLVVHELGRPLF
jgi:DNA-binding beta-propeller fold protein YncE